MRGIDFSSHGIIKKLLGDGAFEEIFAAGDGVFSQEIESAFTAESPERHGNFGVPQNLKAVFAQVQLAGEFMVFGEAEFLIKPTHFFKGGFFNDHVETADDGFGSSPGDFQGDVVEIGD